MVPPSPALVRAGSKTRHPSNLTPGAGPAMPMAVEVQIGIPITSSRRMSQHQQGASHPYASAMYDTYSRDEYSAMQAQHMQQPHGRANPMVPRGAPPAIRARWAVRSALRTAESATASSSPSCSRVHSGRSSPADAGELSLLHAGLVPYSCIVLAAAPLRDRLLLMSYRPSRSSFCWLDFVSGLGLWLLFSLSSRCYLSRLSCLPLFFSIDYPLLLSALNHLIPARTCPPSSPPSSVCVPPRHLYYASCSRTNTIAMPSSLHPPFFYPTFTPLTLTPRACAPLLGFHCAYDYGPA